jgi:Delta3-Delta2-enoyl-CoA isomerase
VEQLRDRPGDEQHAAMIDLTTVDGISVVTLRAGENRFNLPFVSALIDTIGEAAERAKPLVLTGEGKFFSNGLDLDWLRDEGQAQAGELFPALYRLLADVLTFPGVTVAAINGHAFGGGLILSLAADYRVMRSDRGYFCFPEVDLGMSMSDEFDAIIKAKLPADALLHALITGQRFGGDDAKAAGLVHESTTEDALLDTALGIVRPLADKNGETIGRIKAKHFQSVVATLTGGSGQGPQSGS